MDDDDKKLKLLAFQPVVGIASLFTVSAEITMVPQTPKVQLHANTKESSSSTSFIQAGFHPQNPKESILLLFQYSSKQRRGGSVAGSAMDLPMESLSYNNLEGKVSVGTSLSLDDKKVKGDRKKRKSAESLALAPGDQGQEASSAVDLTLGEKTAKIQRKEAGKDEEETDAISQDLRNLEDEEQGESIAERLALLSSAMEQTDDEEDDEHDNQRDPKTIEARKSEFKLKSATSETLSTLLTQALSSNDTIQLNIALQVTDRRLVEDTVRALQLLDAERLSEQEDTDGTVEGKTAGYISTLMAHIVRRIARRHSLLMPLGVWVRAILAAAMRSSTNQVLHGGNTGATDERMAKEARELAMKLGPLKNFLNERVESFPQLLRLDGRLGLLNSQL